jgi:Dna[CI] antecedent, DciA
MNELFRILPKLLKEVEDDETLRQVIVFTTWRKIAGESLAEHAVAISLKNKHLTVAVANERWEKYLKDLSGQMIFKLNSSLGQALVTFIEFCVDEKAVLAEKKTRKISDFDDLELRELALKQLSPKLRAKSNAIKDENLRQIFLKAASTSLARKEQLKNNKD